MTAQTAQTDQTLSARGILLRMVRRHRRRLAAYCALLMQWQLCEALVPVLIGVVIDRAVATGSGTAMVWWGTAFVALFLVLSMSYRFGARIGFRVMQYETHQLRGEVAEHALHPRGVRSTSLTGEVLSLATSDAEHVGSVVRSLGYSLAAAGSIILSAVVLLRADLVVGLVVLIGVPISLGLVQILTPVISRRSAAQQAQIASASGLATDFIRGLRILKGIGAESAASERYAKRSQLARDASIRTTTSYGVMQGITLTTSGVFLAVVALVAGQRAVSGDVTIGQLVAVVGLTQFLAEPMTGLGHVGAQIGMAYASAGRIATFLASPPLLHSGERGCEAPAPMVALQEVDGATVRGVTFHVAPGEMVALAVDDPATASDVVGLLTGERQPTGGEVTLAGVNLAEHRISERRRVMLVNPHHTDLFAGSLRSNIDLLGSLPEAYLTDVLLASATDDVVDLHPDGLEQEVTAKGRTFSGGQQQRIALARALAADPPVLVLHDPTSAVDAVTEQRIAEGIRRIRHEVGSTRSTLLITTSPAHLAVSDRVVQL
ncbi:ABC transporter transmembrane domain-containing protein [Demetria terragena]|uniref:ABC transporter transmembrane domain-containing protein n=1 Tax=Demetria terragena TaxID=63959 RepID=UPI0003634210|nr:ABC transporter ATP-binding protein [Demetria terragena]